MWNHSIFWVINLFYLSPYLTVKHDPVWLWLQWHDNKFSRCPSGVYSSRTISDHVELNTSYFPGFKWFGSLTNVSVHRPSEKADIKAAPVHDGFHSAVKSEEKGQSADDMEACLHSPSYAHSSEMYTHVGTVPRNQKLKKSCKGLKEKKKREKEGEEGVNRGKSQWKSGEYVQHSPMLSALSSLSLTSADQAPPALSARPLPTTPVPSWASPLTSTPDSPVETLKDQEVLSRSKDALETDKSLRHPLNMATNGPKATSQDLYVPMNPIAEAVHSPQSERQTSKQEGQTAHNMQREGSINRWEMNYHTIRWCSYSTADRFSVCPTHIQSKDRYKPQNSPSIQSPFKVQPLNTANQLIGWIKWKTVFF